MKEKTRIFLNIMRDANRQGIALDPDVFDIIVKNLEIDQQGIDEVTQLLEADLLEKHAMRSDFETVKEFIRRKGQ